MQRPDPFHPFDPVRDEIVSMAYRYSPAGSSASTLNMSLDITPMSHLQGRNRDDKEWPESLVGLDCANAERTALGVFIFNAYLINASSHSSNFYAFFFFRFFLDKSVQLPTWQDGRQKVVVSFSALK